MGFKISCSIGLEKQCSKDHLSGRQNKIRILA